MQNNHDTNEAINKHLNFLYQNNKYIIIDIQTVFGIKTKH